MEKPHIRTLITRFFENDFPKEIILKFQTWFTGVEDTELKDEILNDLWEKESTETNATTLYGLREMNRRIGKGHKTKKIPLHQRILRVAAVLLLPVMGALFAYWFMPAGEEQTFLTAEMTEYIVPDGEMKQVLLPDGSEVWLNSGSMLLYSGDLSGSVRSLFLTGEATFYVKKDPERPFVVKTQYTQVEALGTTFNVKSYGDSGLTEVTLEEGLVRVDLNGKVTTSELMYPNEQFVYDHRYGKFSKLAVDAELIAKWKEGYLLFRDASFEDIIRTVERRFNVTVNYNVRKYGGGNFSIKYAPYENVGQVMNIIKSLNPGLKWSRKENIIYIE